MHKQKSAEVLRNPFPENCFAKQSPHFRPATLPEYLEGRTPKEKHPFLFQKKFTPAKSEMQGVFFLSELLAYSASGGCGVAEFITSLYFENRF